MDDKLLEGDSILAFSHIPKAGGTTFIYILSQYFGLRYFRPIPRQNHGIQAYKSENLAQDLNLHFRTKCIGGHWIVPYQDYGRLDNRLVWFTFLRDPISRTLSQYEYQVHRYKLASDFPKWADKFGQKDQQVKQLAGESNLNKAKVTLANKFRAVGLVEKYNESLLIFKDRLGLSDLNLSYGTPKNASQGSIKKKIIKNFDEYRDLIIEMNQLDLKLYEYVLETIWPQQVKDYGEKRLKNNLLSEFCQLHNSSKGRLNALTSRIFRNLIYKPFVKFDSLI